MSVNSLLSKTEFVELLRNDKEFRDSFALEYVKNSIPSQLRALRKERDWTQEDLGRETKKPRNVITRLENPNSNIPNLYTMLEMAWGCEAALVVKVVPFSELLKEYDKPFEAFYAPKISSKSEIEKLNAWAMEEDEEEPTETTKPNLTLVVNNTGNYSEPIQPRLRGLGLRVVPTSTSDENQPIIERKEISTSPVVYRTLAASAGK